MRHEFVEHLPDHIESDIIYISIRFGIVAHRCACGCGKEVVTPLSPIEWKLTYDGESVSLYPSIGNWSLPCRSHYWIERNQVRWARSWSAEQVEKGRERERAERDRYYGNDGDGKGDGPPAPTQVAEQRKQRRFRQWLKSQWERWT